MKLAATVSRSWWTLERFGLSPGKLRARLVPGAPSGVACTSVPKAGTHLLERALCLHPELYRAFVRTLNTRQVKELGGVMKVVQRLQRGQVLLLHLKHSTRDEAAFTRSGVRCVFLQRDPRDVVVSQAHYALANEDHPLHEAFRNRPDLRSRVRLAIEGDGASGLESVGTRLRQFSGWLDADCFRLRFEDLVGPQGGGSRIEQTSVLTELFDYLQVDTSGALIHRIAERLFSSASPTFRQGGVGRWREVFDDGLKAVFKRVAGDQLIRYGYEASEDW